MQDFSIQVFTDGGKRNENHAASAWVIFVVKRDACKEIGNGAIHLPQHDSFQTETLAMEYAVQPVSSILRKREAYR